MNAVGNVRCSVVSLGEHDLTHETARAKIERINPVTCNHASALAPRKGNQGFKASVAHVVWINEMASPD
jgi:hypothetical protein